MEKTNHQVTANADGSRKSEGLKALGSKTRYKMDYAPEVLEKPL